MITLKQTQKAKVNQLVEKFNYAKQKGNRNIYDVYNKPSLEKEYAYHHILEVCFNELNSFDYYIVGYNSNTFSMICKYTGNNGETRLRYWTAYNTYDCKMI